MSDLLTSMAAVIAAILSAISIIVHRRAAVADAQATREWQLQTWIMDELLESIVNMLNLSFKIGHHCRSVTLSRRTNHPEVGEGGLRLAQQLHGDFMDSMVNLRVLGSKELVASVEALHLALDHLLDISFEPEIANFQERPFVRSGVPTDLSEVEARSACMDMREALLNDARELLGLPRDAIINRSV